MQDRPLHPDISLLAVSRDIIGTFNNLMFKDVVTCRDEKIRGLNLIATCEILHYCLCHSSVRSKRLELLTY